MLKYSISIFSYLREWVTFNLPRPLMVAINNNRGITVSKLIKGRYCDNSDGTVTDIETGLQWMRCLIGQEWLDGRCQGDVREMNWDNAMALKIDFAGYSDWRLPTLEELISLAICHSDNPDYSSNVNGVYTSLTLVKEAFPNVPRFHWAWSSSQYHWPYPKSPRDDNTDYVWCAGFNTGLNYGKHRNSEYHVRMVRGGKC
jgi:hypothetical protein